MNSINILDILPKTNRRGYPFYSKLMGDNIFLSYKTLGRGKSYYFPNKLILDEEFFIGFSLSLGDGLNNPSIRNTHYNFSNNNYGLVKLIYDWLIKYFNINEKDFQFFLFSKDQDNTNSINNITTMFNISKSLIKTYFSDRHDKDTLTIQMSNPIFQSIYLNLFIKLQKIIINNRKFRLAFLKGLFAAEGHMKHSKYNTIESINYSYNPKTELELAEFIQECLSRESIKNRNNETGTVYICGYQNLIRFYLLGTMDLHKKKRNKLLKLIKNTKFILYFQQNSLSTLRNINQNKLAKILHCSQPCISKLLSKNYLSLKNLEVLNSKNLLNKEMLLKKK